MKDFLNETKMLSSVESLHHRHFTKYYLVKTSEESQSLRESQTMLVNN